MKLPARITVLLLAVVSVLCEGTAADNAVRTYRSDMLQNMAAHMRITGKMNTLPDGDNFFTHTDGREVNVRIADGVVEHIGYRLFDIGQKKHLSIPLTDFLERYWLSLTLPMEELRSADARMREDHFYFITGNVSSVDRIQRDSLLMLNFTPTDKMIDVEWSDASGDICHLVVPVSHELIMGRNMLENNRRLADEIRNAHADSALTPRYTNDMLVQDDSTSLLVRHGGFYYLDELSANRYFFPAPAGKETVPVWSESFPCQSITNLFSGTDIAVAADIPLHIRHVGYGRIEEFDTDVRHFVDFCLAQGCTPYVGIVSMAGDEADVIVMMCNMQLGYNHLLRLKIGTSGLTSGTVTASGRLNAYIPTANLKNLFKDDNNDSLQ